eukprot:6676242-Pyramimonas_sp.AAC.1
MDAASPTRQDMGTFISRVPPVALGPRQPRGLPLRVQTHVARPEARAQLQNAPRKPQKGPVECEWKCCTFSADNLLLAAGTSSGRIVIWDAATLEAKADINLGEPGRLRGSFRCLTLASRICTLAAG